MLKKRITQSIISIFLLLAIFISATPQTSFASNLLPIGGDEWPWAPADWEPSTCYVNCYAYAVFKICAASPNVKIQPGQLSGQKYTSLTESSIIAAVKRDMGENSIYKTTAYAVPPDGWRKVALVISPGNDYHWYEQNSNRYWSHKQGLSPVSNVDASGSRIANPQTCDRNYSFVYKNQQGNTYVAQLNYSTFCGFYMVNN